VRPRGAGPRASACHGSQRLHVTPRAPAGRSGAGAASIQVKNATSFIHENRRALGRSNDVRACATRFRAAQRPPAGTRHRAQGDAGEEARADSSAKARSEAVVGQNRPGYAPSADSAGSGGSRAGTSHHGGRRQRASPHARRFAPPRDDGRFGPQSDDERFGAQGDDDGFRASRDAGRYGAPGRGAHGDGDATRWGR